MFAVLQSAPVQDADPTTNGQRARNTRVLAYDVGGTPTPTMPIAEYALVLNTYRSNGNGAAPNKTTAQSEIVALDNSRFLMLPRDGNGLGNNATNPSMFKSVMLVDTSLGSPSNVARDVTKDNEGGTIHVALDGLSNNAVLSNAAAVTATTSEFTRVRR